MKLVLQRHLPFPDPVIGVTFCAGANRLLVGFGAKPTLVLDATTGKTIAKLPKDATVAAIDAAGSLAAISEAGRAVAGRHTWSVWLWDLVKAKKLARLATNHPDDNLTPAAIGNTYVLCTRKRKTAYSLCLFDRAGTPVKEYALGDVPLPFHAALSPDERTLAHAYFTGAAGIVDAASGKAGKLAGGVLRIGRQHDKGISELAFDGASAHLLYVSAGSGSVHVWNTRTRKSLTGGWLDDNVQEAFFSGDSLVVLHSGSQDATATIHALAPTKARARKLVLGTASLLFATAGDPHLLACAGHTNHDAYAKSGLALHDLVAGKRLAKATLPTTMKAVMSLAACAGKVAVGDRADGVAIFEIR